jgi:hypothetical protein
MAITTYGELKTAVASWLNRSDLTSQIPDFITLAEANIARDVRARAMEKRVTAAVSSQYEALPADLLELRNVQLNTDPVRRLRYMTPEQLDTTYASSATGKPQAYTIFGSEIQFAPIPDGEYTAELAYFYRPAAFSADTDTNSLLTSHPGLYLYAALVAAEPFIQNDERVGVWAALYRQEVDAINRSDRQARYSGSALVVRNDTGNP